MQRQLKKEVKIGSIKIGGTNPIAVQTMLNVPVKDIAGNVAQAERDVVAAAVALQQAHPHLQSIVLECTNMPVYRAAVAHATGLPVHDIVSLLAARWAALH